ncbi:MAG: hypothetical protein J6B88_00905 [Clostridia bacterium]|nr:hypothetical protein [Clostridia bacterium]
MQLSQNRGDPNLEKALQNKITENDTKTERRRFFCPICGKHTVLWLLPDTEIKNLPIKCKRCAKESIINVEPIIKP